MQQFFTFFGKLTMGFLGLVALFYGTMGFVGADPAPDFQQRMLSTQTVVSLDEVPTKHNRKGSFKTIVTLQAPTVAHDGKDFYGYEITPKGQAHFDKIRLGVTNQRIVRAEVWQGGQLVKAKEMGFFQKTESGDAWQLELSYNQDAHLKQQYANQLAISLYDKTRFWGDIAGISLDVSPYGGVPEAMTLSLFAISLSDGMLPAPHFSDMRIWRNYTSWD